MSLSDPVAAEPESGEYDAAIADLTGAPLGDLPRLSSRQVEFDRRVRRLGDREEWARRLLPGLPIEVGLTELVWRATGLSRPGLVAQFAWPRLDVRVGLGLETPITHAIVDQLLGFERLPAEGYRQVSPVEWGIMTFVLARALDRLDAICGPLGPWDLTIDRVGPDPFDVRDLGPIVTWRWPVRIGTVAGSIRLWMPESLLNQLDITPRPAAPHRPGFSSLSSVWRAEAGTISLARGISRLKVGGVFPIDDASLKGTVTTPLGPIALVCRDLDGRSWIEVESVSNTSAARVTVKSPPQREPTPREPIAMNPSSNAAATADVPVTLVVELGRVNLPLSRLADLKPGDVIELGRHSREPVELTSNGKLIARGELVQIDTELGVRILNVFL